MTPIIASKRREIAELCRLFHVRRLDVFGSAARGTDFTEESDIDFLVEYGPEHAPGLREYFDLRDALSRLLEREIDLVEMSAIRNPYLRAEIEHSRQLLHAA
ncbi:MAG: nucleotidyltransferase family protein [Hyphomicrobiales bacterium]